MNISDLIWRLQDIVAEHGEEVEVRLAIQPEWPFEHGIGDVVVVNNGDQEEMQADLDANEADMTEDEIASARLAIMEETERSETIVYLAEAGQIGYLPGAAKNALGWGR